MNVELWRESGGIRELVYGRHDIMYPPTPIHPIHLTPATSGTLTFRADDSQVQVFEGDNIELYLNDEILWIGYIEMFTAAFGPYLFAECQPTRNTFNDVLMQWNTLHLYSQVHSFDGSIPVRKLDIDFGTLRGGCLHTCVQYESLQKWKLRKDDRACGGG